MYTLNICGVRKLTKYVDYDEEGKFFGKASEPLSVEAYVRYKSVVGEEKAEGYYQAIKDMTDEIGFILGGFCESEHHPDHTHHITPQIVKNYISKLYAHNTKFLNWMYDENNSRLDQNSNPAP